MMGNDRDDELLTATEQACVKMAGDLWNELCNVVGDGATRTGDLAELVIHIHAIQSAVLAQAAARRYPSMYRPLGGTLKPHPEPTDDGE